MRRTSIIGLMVAMSLAGAAHGQAVATLAVDTIALGDQTTLSISGLEQFPSTDMLTQGGIVALSQTFDTATGMQTTVLTSFEPGTHYVHYSPNDSLPLTVTDVTIDTTQAELRDLAPQQRVPYTFWEIFRWVLLALGVAALAVGGWWLWKKWKSGQMTEWLSNEKPDTRTPHQRAAERLEQLRQQRLWQAGKVKDYHTELTDTVRRFVEEATGIRATDMTSDETVEAVGAQWPATVEALRSIFATADMVKFAKSEPLPHEHEAAMANAMTFVDTLWSLVHHEPDDEAANRKEDADA